jgi:16S rRNA processing protein RimM
LTSSTPDSGGAHRLLAGTVGRPHGLDGSFHVINPSPGLLALGAVVLVGESLQLRIDRRAGTDARPILRFEGYADRAAVQSLRGLGLRVERAEAPPLEPDEWWAEDLVGCAVSDGARPVGTVARLLSLPSCEVLEVARDAAAGAEPATLLVPLVSDAVRSVDIERRAIDIDLRFLGEAEG